MADQNKKKIGEVKISAEEEIKRKVEIEPEKPLGKELPASPTITSPTGGKSKGGPKKKAGAAARAKPVPPPVKPVEEVKTSPFIDKPSVKKGKPEVGAGEPEEPEEEERKREERERPEREREKKGEKKEEFKEKEVIEEEKGKEGSEESKAKEAEKTKPEKEPIGGRLEEKPKAAAKGAKGAAKGTGTATRAGAAGAKAGGIKGWLSGAANTLRSEKGKGLNPWAWAAILAILILLAIIILVFGAIACSNIYGVTPGQGSDADEAERFLRNAGKTKEIMQMTADKSLGLQDNLKIISDQAGDSDISSLSDDAIDILESLIGLNANQTASRNEMISQINGKYQEILDLLGVYLIDLPGHLENLGQREIKELRVKTSERRIYFYSSNDLVLGSAPIYFGYNQSLPSGTTMITTIKDAGEGNHFVDKNDYSFGRYYIELEGGPGAIIGANSKDEILKTGDQSIAMLRATSGPLRMFSKDIEILAKHLKQGIGINFIHE